MTGNVETEIKLAATPAMLRHLRGHPLLAGADRSTTLVSRYFDTPARALRQHKATLRVREDGAGNEQTFKIIPDGGDSIRRSEWNVPLAGAVPDPGAFPPEPEAILRDLIDGEPLRPLAATRIERTSRRLRFGGSTIEAAFDLGAVEAGPRDEAVAELELELIDGTAADIFALVRELPIGPELMWSTVSKAARSYALALAEAPRAVHAERVALCPGMTVAEGFRAVAWNCLAQLLANYRLVIATGEPGAVHQSRVAIRRLRAAFSLFGRAVADETSPVLRAEWKTVAANLGPARDLHVLITQVEKAENTDADLLPLLDGLRRKRNDATRSAQALLTSSAFQDLLFQTADWLENGNWQSGAHEADQPLAGFAADILARRRRKLVRAGRKFHRLSPEALHALRIQGKKLRYGTEFFAALYEDEMPRRFSRALGKLQDRLGSLHDIDVAEAGRETLFTDLEPITAAKRSAELAHLLDRHGPSRKGLLKAAAKSMDRVRHAPAWWKHPAEPA